MSSSSSSVQAGAETGRNVFSVTRLNREVRMLLERGLGVVWVEGELSNFSVPSSGHWYFSLKDRDAQVRCAMFKLKNSTLGFTPKSGQQVLARGRISLYEPRGDYQLIVEHMEEAGVGALKREFERLKAKLAAEGLFALERKRGLPRFPRRIGVVTSPSGAAIRDVLHILRRRFPPASVLIYPTAVQGAAAVPAIVEALQTAYARNECDVLIVARGGGSIEDLWCFNDERVARAICASPIPTVSGVGHEIDFTIADFVADARAPTPSGAAELVAPDRDACLEALSRTAMRMTVCMRREYRSVSVRFESVLSRLKLVHPGVRLSQQAQRLDELEQRLVKGVGREIRVIEARVASLARHLNLAHPGLRLSQFRSRHEALESRLRQAWKDYASVREKRLLTTSVALEQIPRTYLAAKEHRLQLAVGKLNTASPLATLGRGFALVTGPDGALVRDSSAVNVGDEIEARLAQGRIKARVTGKE
jgi:exodeoxyribonuclease VII large subunit